MYLATTAIKEFWDPSQRMIFLGEWCRIYSHHQEWEGLNYKIMPYPWQSKEDFAAAFAYCDGLFERILPRLAKQLNMIHNTRYSTRYWRIVVGEWLWRYIQILYERYVCLKKAFRDYGEDLETKVLDTTSYSIAFDSDEFLEMCYTDHYNLQLYSLLLRYMGKDYPAQKMEPPLRLRSQLRAFLRNIKRTIGDMVLNKRFYPGRIAEVVLCRANMLQDVLRELRKADKALFKVVSWEKTYIKVRSQRILRTAIKFKDDGDDFANICIKMIADCIPLAFVEGFGELVGQLAKDCKYPKAVISATGWRFDVLTSLYIGKAVEQGARLIGIQHGGGYGLFEMDSMLTYELRTVDYFFSWGWALPGEKVIPLPSHLLSQRSVAKSVLFTGKKTAITFVSSAHARFFNYFQSSPMGPQYEKYFGQQIEFFRQLRDEVKAQLLVRLYPADYDWNNRHRLEDAIPGLRYDNPLVPFLQRALSSRLVISDNNQTTYLQTIGLNIPTLIFWDQELWPLHEKARPVFEILKRSNIFHETPGSAAAFLNDNYHRIEEWWGSPDVQSAVGTFRTRYARADENWAQQWHDQILECINHTK